MHSKNNYIDKTQVGFLFYIERLARSHPIIYFITRYIANLFCLFEEDFKGVAKLGFTKKINIIDIGGSDGIATKFINKMIKINKAHIFEPHKVYNKFLKRIKINKKIYNYGLSNIEGFYNIYTPMYNFLCFKFFLPTYAYYDKNHLKKVVKQNFFFTKKIKIVKSKIWLKKVPLIRDKIDLIKIDVNGHEYQIVKSLFKIINRDKPVLIIEELTKIDLIKKILKKNNYICFHYDHKEKTLKEYIKNKSSPVNFYFISKKNK